MRSSLYVTLTVALAASPLALALPSQGSGSPHQQLAKRAAAASIFSPAGAQKNNYALLGCYNDLYPNSRALNGAYSDNPSGGQTIGKCLSFCASQGGYLAGLENGNQCFCGSQLDPASKVTQPANGISVSNNGGCSTPCAGNSTQDCGGPNRLLIFQSNTGVPAKIGTVPNANYKGCYADNQNKRLLPYVYQGDTNPSMTPQLCASGCTNRGYDLSGTEYRYQCFCGSSTSVNLGSTISAASCSSTCTGDGTQLCGGPGALTVYQKTGGSTTPPANRTIVQTVAISSSTVYKYQGEYSMSLYTSASCYTDQSSPRALTGAHWSDPSMTVEKCAAYCNNGRFKFAGLQYSTECWCGATLASFSKPQSGSACNMGCAGNATETCGGGYANTLYKSG